MPARWKRGGCSRIAGDGIPDFIANPGGAIAAVESDVTDEENARTSARVTEAKEFTEQAVAATSGGRWSWPTRRGSASPGPVCSSPTARVFGEA